MEALHQLTPAHTLPINGTLHQKFNFLQHSYCYKCFDFQFLQRVSGSTETGALVMISKNFLFLTKAGRCRSCDRNHRQELALKPHMKKTNSNICVID